jgi:hypothetical protein
MRHLVRLFIAALTIAVPAAAAAADAPGVASIAGTFNCVTHTNDGTIWRFHSVNHPWGAWVRADTTFAPQNGLPAQVSSTFVGFDAAAKQWNIVSIDRAGSYYTRYSSSPAFNGSQWTDGYPADGAHAMIHVTPQQYTFDFRAAPKNGKSDASRTICTRV